MTLPEKFKTRPRSKQLESYIAKRYSTHGYPKAKAIEYNRESKDKRYRWVEHPADGLRFVGKAHEIRGDGNGNTPYFERSIVDHTGWFIDQVFQDETVCGEVYQLPARDGKPVYVPAVSDPFNDGALIDFNSATDDLIAVIRWADSMAERYAEDEREFRAKDMAEQRIEEIDTEIAEKYAAFKALAKEIRANCDAVKGLAELRKLIRAEYRRVKATVRKLRTEKRKLEDDFWAVTY